jgi:hypothetical protein
VNPRPDARLCHARTGLYLSTQPVRALRGHLFARMRNARKNVVRAFDIGHDVAFKERKSGRNEHAASRPGNAWRVGHNHTRITRIIENERLIVAMHRDVAKFGVLNDGR